MRARRNSPSLDSTSPYMRKLLDEKPPRSSPRGTMEMPGMETDAAAVLLMSEKRRKERKEYDKKAAAREFEFQLRAYNLPKPFSYINTSKQLSHEYRYCVKADELGVEARDFRADYAWPDYRLLVELNGGIWIRGAHAHPLNIERDIIKHQYAALLGWYVLPITTDQVKDGHGIAWLQRVLCARGWKP